MVIILIQSMIISPPTLVSSWPYYCLYTKMARETEKETDKKCKEKEKEE